MMWLFVIDKKKFPFYSEINKYFDEMESGTKKKRGKEKISYQR